MSTEPRWGMGFLLSEQEGKEPILPTELRLGVGDVHRTQGRGAWRRQVLTTESGKRADPPHRTPGDRGHTFVIQLKASARTRAQSWQPPCNSQGSGGSSHPSPHSLSKPTPQSFDLDLSSAPSLWARPVPIPEDFFDRRREHSVVTS